MLPPRPSNEPVEGSTVCGDTAIDCALSLRLCCSASSGVLPQGSSGRAMRSAQPSSLACNLILIQDRAARSIDSHYCVGTHVTVTNTATGVEFLVVQAAGL